MTRKRGVARRSYAQRRVRRVKKYDHNVIPRRFKIQLPDFADRLKPPLDIHVECEEPTMELLEALGVASDEWQYYLGFMKRMIELYLNFTAETLQKEKDSLIAEYVLRGKDKDVLEEVQEQAAECAGVIVEMDLWIRDFYKIIQFQHTDGFTWNTDGSGSYSISEGNVSMSTGAIINSLTYMTHEIYYPTLSLLWNKERRIKVKVRFSANTNQIIYVVSGIPPDVPIDPTERCIGFKIVNNEIFGCVSNGIVETLTAALKSFNAGDSFILEARLKPDQECRFYIDDVDVGAITTNLPQVALGGGFGQEHLATVEMTNTAAENKDIEFDLWEFYQKR